MGSSCDFCAMLIGRTTAKGGGVYSASSVAFRSHDHCNCSAAPDFSGVLQAPRIFDTGLGDSGINPLDKKPPIELGPVTAEDIEAARRKHFPEDEMAFLERRGRAWAKQNPDDPKAYDTYMNGHLVPRQYSVLRESYTKQAAADHVKVLDDHYFATDDAFDVNVSLRAGEVDDHIEQLQEAARSWRTPEPVRVYRGVWGMDLPQDMVGATWKDRGFMSTTFDEGRAVTWTQRRGENPVVFDIDVPKGAPATIGKDQDELLIPDGAELKILSDQTEKTWSGGSIRRLKCVLVNAK